jgi:hypothetical protein
VCREGRESATPVDRKIQQDIKLYTFFTCSFLKHNFTLISFLAYFAYFENMQKEAYENTCCVPVSPPNVAMQWFGTCIHVPRNNKRTVERVLYVVRIVSNIQGNSE